MLDQLRIGGYDRLTMESVAAAAGTGKAALYRRWPARDELVADALRSALPDPSRIPLTGDTRTDALAILMCVRDAMGLASDTAFRVVKQQSAGCGGEPNLLQRTIRQRVMFPCRDLLRRVVEQAHGGPVGDHVVAVGQAMLSHYAITESENIPESFVAAVVDDVLMPLVRGIAG